MDRLPGAPGERLAAVGTYGPVEPVAYRFGLIQQAPKDRPGVRHVGNELLLMPMDSPPVAIVSMQQKPDEVFRPQSFQFVCMKDDPYSRYPRRDLGSSGRSARPYHVAVALDSSAPSVACALHCDPPYRPARVVGASPSSLNPASASRRRQ